jgi:hypothetical protein
MVGIIFYSILFVFPEPEEPDNDKKGWEKIGPDDSRDRKMEGIILCSQNKDPNDRRNPSGQAFPVTEDTSDSKSNDDPWPSFP